jgi:hypothetical protein
MLKSTLLDKSKIYAAYVIVIFMVMTSMCNCLPFLNSKEVNNNNPLPDMESIFASRENNRHISLDYTLADNYILSDMDTIVGTPAEKIIKYNSDTLNKDNLIKSKDSTMYDMFGDLLNDDPLYYQKKPLWVPAVEVIGVNFIVSLLNTYIFNADFSRVGFKSWGRTIKSGWPWGPSWFWDRDRFALNFFSHPFGGAFFYNAARVTGYDYWASMGFTLYGSYMWKIFGETGVPEREDLINTTFSGAMAGEVTYRLSSILLDDRTMGFERFLRELGAGIVNPVRFANRLINGDLSRVTSEEIYQKEPINVEFSAGIRFLNAGRDFGKGSKNTLLNLQLDYGYPFENRTRKPFDFFTGRSELNFGTGRKITGSLTGEGILYGKNEKSGNFEMLFGLFQHYDYFDNLYFELGTIAFGGGIMSRYPFYKDSYLYTNIYLAIVPFGGNSTQLGPDTSQFRDYNFVGGAETKVEFGLNLYWGSIDLVGYYWWLRTYNAAGAPEDGGAVGDNNVVLLKPRISVKIYQNLSIGFEQLWYYTDRYMDDKRSFHDVRTEQKIYLTVNIGNFKL